jgi:hypothetical protein
LNLEEIISRPVKLDFNRLNYLKTEQVELTKRIVSGLVSND